MALTIDGPTPARPEAAPADIRLEGAVADAYVARLLRGIRAARLNAFFPPARVVRDHLSFLGPRGSSGVYDDLYLSPLTGLPTAREILRVKIDRDLTGEFLAGAAEQRAPAPDSPLAKRIAYYSRLATTREVMPASRMKVELRRHLPEQRRAQFRVVFDRFDLASGTFARYTILLTQRDELWTRRHVIVDDADLAAPTEAFRRVVGRFAAHEAELAFVLLSRLETLEVEDVRRCRIGPMILPGARLGAALEALLDPDETPAAAEEPPWILCFPEDRAGIEVAEHAAGDPLAPLFRDAIDAEARAVIDEVSDQLGYRVAKQRKFVCPRPLVGPLSALCRELGRPSIVRGV